MLNLSHITHIGIEKVPNDSGDNQPITAAFAQ
jgi:hypothetical protein